MAALFSRVHDGMVSTVTRGGKPVQYKVSEHKVGGCSDSAGKPIDVDMEAQIDGLSSTPVTCELCQRPAIDEPKEDGRR